MKWVRLTLIVATVVIIALMVAELLGTLDVTRFDDEVQREIDRSTNRRFTLTGAQGSILVNAAAASRLVLSAPTSVNANAAFSLTVTVVDAYGNIVTDYRGTLSFSSSDPTARLPRNYTFTAADRGVYTFTNLRLKRRGTQTITVTDTLNGSLTSSAIVDVI